MQLIFESISNRKGEVVKQESLARGMLRYEMICTDSGDVDFPKSYSVTVESRLTDETCSETILDLTANENYAYEFFERLVLFSVTPVSLYEVAEDFIAEKYCL